MPADYRAEERMQIALVGARSYPAEHGGIERAVENLALQYAAAGHEVTVYSSPGSRPAPSGPGAPRVRTVPALRTKYTHTLSQTLLAAVEAARSDADVVHVHGVGPGIAIPVLRRVPTVLTVHALDFERDKWPPAARALFRGLSGPGVRRAGAVVAVAEHLRTSLQQLYGVTATVIPNGVATEGSGQSADRLAGLGLTSGGYLLFVGRLVPEKRLDLLLRAYARLGAPLPLVVVGAGAGSYAAGYDQSLRELATGDVRFLGEQPHEAVCDLLAHARLFVNPSGLEGLPLTVLEARALGTPVLLSDIAPHRELLGPGGALFADGDEDALVARLGEALDGRAASRAEAAEGRATVAATYSWESVATRTLDVYREVLGR
jgi:glycosyltransferase involved in cell wall biosynthesis